jgi:GT2 family glycosyltransferase
METLVPDKPKLGGWSTPAPTLIKTRERPRVSGKFIFLGDKKLYIRGVTYGAFRPNEDGIEFHDRDLIDRDFRLMAANGITAVRIPHTTPPRYLLDIAQRHGLHVMIGLSAEQYVGYLIDTKDAPDIDEIVRAKVRAVASHPALLCYAIGNEIPAPMARWLGRRRVERYLEKLYHVIKDEDPEGLVTYVNYPTTEYLQLPFLDLLSFNVYLETRERLESYLPRLQNIAGDRPLIMSEVGLDSIRNGEETQASVLEWQIESAFAAGCAGAFIFAWTDEWYRGDDPIDEWAFGITDHQRRPKPALASVRKAFERVPFPADSSWPRVSVIVCSYNGASNIRDCCEALAQLDYPDYEVIVVNDGSTDATADIARDYDFKLINTENHGLSNARNTGLEAATGNIVAYIDDDAFPDRHWLTYLASTFMSTDYAGVGGPNIAPFNNGSIADCVANAPGGPVHVLLSDQVAEHIPGCNMAFRADALQKIGGFDPQFRVAGDDVDVCWRIQQQGWSIGFNAAAMVWHYSRNSIGAFWKQQVGYGKAEGMLVKKWPDKHNSLGHWHWSGRIYGLGLTKPLPVRQPQVFHGVWGSAPFQSIYEPSPGTILSLSLMPEWYLLVLLLLVFSSFGLLWSPLLLALPFLFVAVSLPIIQALQSATQAYFPYKPRSHVERLKLHGLTTFLHLLQPAARLWGRMKSNLTPWRRHRATSFAFPRLRTVKIWSERWRAPEERLESIESTLRMQSTAVVRGGDYDDWDLEVRGGLFGSVRTIMAVEDHGSGTQLIRYRTWPRLGLVELLLLFLAVLLAVVAALGQVWLATLLLALAAIAIAIRLFSDCAAAMGSFLEALEQSSTAEEQQIP